MRRYRRLFFGRATDKLLTWLGTRWSAILALAMVLFLANCWGGLSTPDSSGSDSSGSDSSGSDSSGSDSSGPNCDHPCIDGYVCGGNGTPSRCEAPWVKQDLPAGGERYELRGIAISAVTSEVWISAKEPDPQAENFPKPYHILFHAQGDNPLKIVDPYPCAGNQRENHIFSLWENNGEIRAPCFLGKSIIERDAHSTDWKSANIASSGAILHSIWNNWIVGWIGKTKKSLVLKRNPAGEWLQSNMEGLDSIGPLRGIWGIAADDIWIIGDQYQDNNTDGNEYRAIIAHCDGKSCKIISTLSEIKLHSIWGTAFDNFWIAGNRGTILHWDGKSLTSWTQAGLDIRSSLWGVGGVSENDAWIVGQGGTILHWDGSIWNKVHPSVIPTERPYLRTIKATKQEAWIIGNDGVVLRRRTR